MKYLYADTETFSPIDIRKHGTYRYAEEVEVLLFPYAIDDGQPKVWDRTQDKAMPADLKEALYNPEVVKVFHNSIFDRTVLRLGMGLDIPISQIEDTMVQAYAHSLPGALATLCEVMQVPSESVKSKEGRRLIRLFCIPQTKKKNGKTIEYRATALTDPDDWQKFKDYAASDITAMREIHKRMPRWNYPNNAEEYALWVLDQGINDRGFKVDLELTKAVMNAVDFALDRVNQDIKEFTDGVVERATQATRIKKYLKKHYDLVLPNMQKATLAKVAEDPDIPEGAKRLLDMRSRASKTSTSKYNSLLSGTSTDGRMRGTLQFDGASRTGRWSGRQFQPQNLPRPTFNQDKINTAIDCMLNSSVDLVFDNIMEASSNLIRSCIVPSDDKKLVVADLSNIEGRFAAWVADEEWKVKAFRDFDQGKGHDLYKLAYARAFDIDPEDVNKDQRAIGKVMELFLQYQGGVGAFLTGAKAYGIDLDAMADLALPNIKVGIQEEAKSYLAHLLSNKEYDYPISHKAFIACDSLKRLWRRNHPNIQSFWDEISVAFINAANNPKVEYRVGRLVFRRDGTWLRLRLPSGRFLCYSSPVGDPMSGNFSYMGWDSQKRKWVRENSYGGKLFENICQAGSRDILGYSMPKMAEAGYDTLLTVHDEIIAEARDLDRYSVEQMSAIMADNPPWAKGLPLAADGFEGYRYRKD